MSQAPKPIQEPPSFQKNSSLFRMLSILGALFVLVGLIILVREDLRSLSFALKISAVWVAVMGSGVATFMLFKNPQHTTFTAVFYLIFSGCISLGLYMILWHICGPHSALFIHDASVPSIYWAMAINALMGLMHTGFLFLFRKNQGLQQLATFFIIWAVTLIYCQIVWGLGYARTPIDGFWLTGLALSYIVTGFLLFRFTSFLKLSQILYFFGIPALILGNFPFLDDGRTHAGHILFLFSFYCLNICMIFLGVFLKSLTFSIWGIIGLLLAITVTTAEFFNNSLGWPIALILLGLLAIGLSYMIFLMREKGPVFFSSLLEKIYGKKKEE